MILQPTLQRVKVPSGDIQIICGLGTIQREQLKPELADMFG
jgi:hypothetical protein